MYEISIAAIGNVDSGKSTLAGTLTKDVLDDGRGFARNTIIKYNHEKETGRTSTITKYIIERQENKYYTLVDLAGHEKYLKTTLLGLSSMLIDHCLILIGANMGISKMTKEHLGIAVALKKPLTIILTKIDIAPKSILKQTIKDLKLILKRIKHIKGYKIYGEDFKNKNYDNYNLDDINFSNDFINIICVSNVTGYNLKFLKKYVTSINSITNWKEKVKNESRFTISSKFNVNGVGLVLSGQITNGIISKNDKLFLGPFYGRWIRFNVKSIHNDFCEDINNIKAGEGGCLAIRCFDKKDEYFIKHRKFKKGLIVVSNKTKSYWNFKSEVLILNSHCTTICRNYQPVINCNSIVQCAKLININKNEQNIENKQRLIEKELILEKNKEDVLRGGDKSISEFKFCHRPEFIEVGDIFIFREGRTRGLGKIIEISNEF